MKCDVFQIDAFAARVFAGNPALICCLDEWPEDELLQAITAEHGGGAVVAFLVDRGPHLEIRYFMSIGELGLVGHASLAAAHVVLRILRPGLAQAVLQRRKGALKVAQLDDDLLAITLPALPAERCEVPPALATALGVPLREVRVNQNQYFAILDSETTVAAVAPDMNALMTLDRDGVIITAPGRASEFVSRAFAPKEGLPEDPVCGSAHLALVPYWSERLGRREHVALQLSPRGGELHCALLGDEVRLAGQCALYMQGTIHI
ncbi:PhzF family phenazine biosynthesis protein [Aestuariivirga sp. YIM B02566]|uniref:PhzF family phenazine biosynthesis protein n=1 Tax=Taklimakanibacter albus TaxID=2800327 RepID=A0ACC5RAG1_9HYPH|nr:PhzF family phenazine biosynthesis isomerase [Aestuariivirga sp. YIM B02566]MBK1869582.1 PhzF family phenazine biosynthesis protein [Aestuariivirga sp. YIM B02566]